MRLNVRVIPNAKQNGISGKRGEEVLLRISTRAADGKANRATIDFLAKFFGVSKSSVHLVAGEKSRHKKFEIVGLDPDLGAKALSGFLDSV